MKFHSTNLRKRFPLVDKNADYVITVENSPTYEVSYRDGKTWVRDYSENNEPYRPMNLKGFMTKEQIKEALK